MIKVVTSSWWQSNEGFQVDDHGKILTGAFPGKQNEFGETNKPLERETLKAIKQRPYGTLLGSGHDPAFFYDPTPDAIEELRGEGMGL